MRTLGLLVLAVAMAGLVLAPATPALAGAKTAVTKTHDMKATVVSVDAEKKLLTIKDEKGAEMTPPVLPGAEAQLKGLKVGDMITLTCQDDDKGEHQGVSKITHGKSQS